MEVGSEFNLSLSELSTVKFDIFNYFCQTGMAEHYVDSGRSAIKLLLEKLKFDGEILLPEFICESVIRCFPIESVKFYNVSEEFVADVDDIANKITQKTRAIFLLHYFGSLQPEKVRKRIAEMAYEKRLVIIEDVTHSLFSSPHTIGDFVIASIRKWFHVPSGGVLLSAERYDLSFFNKDTDNRKAYGMVLKDLFLRNELDCNPVYRKIFLESEIQLDKKERIFQISDFSKFIMHCVDIPYLISKRKQNYLYLKDLLQTYGMKPAIQIDENCCPLVFPIRIPERDKFRKYVIDKKSYCAVHGPRDGINEECRKNAVRNSEELISLPIDQRYGIEQMQFIAEIIGRFGGELQF